MVLKGTWKLVLLLFFFVNSCKYSCSNITNEEDMELERQLKILNKPPIKTILDEGDIIDCIDIHKQAAFDHPLLKNHKINLHPTSLPNGLAKSKTSSTMKNTAIRYMKEACPSGTVPIKRTSKEDLKRTRSLSEPLPGVGIHLDNTNGNSNKIVSVTTKIKNTPYYGASGLVPIYNLSIVGDQSSSTNMWVQSVRNDDINFITTGWKISERLNGDRQIRLFTYWAGGKKTRGCYNTLCPGFVVTNNKFGPNTRLGDSSIRDDEKNLLDLSIRQDPSTGDWWLEVSSDTVDNSTEIGYWPKEIFNLLQDGAEHVAWGGTTNAGTTGIYPPMGNGYKPNTFDDDAFCFFHQLHFFDGYSYYVKPKNDVTEFTDRSGCYGLLYFPDDEYLFFGGPGGGNCGT